MGITMQMDLYSAAPPATTATAATVAAAFTAIPVPAVFAASPVPAAAFEADAAVLAEAFRL